LTLPYYLVSTVIWFTCTQNIKEEEIDCKIGRGELERNLLEIRIEPRGQNQVIIELVSQDCDVNTAINSIKRENQGKFALVAVLYVLSVLVMSGALFEYGVINIGNYYKW
jgi:hypothetical protein